MVVAGVTGWLDQLLLLPEASGAAVAIAIGRDVAEHVIGERFVPALHDRHIVARHLPLGGRMAKFGEVQPNGATAARLLRRGLNATKDTDVRVENVSFVALGEASRASLARAVKRRAATAGLNAWSQRKAQKRHGMLHGEEAKAR